MALALSRFPALVQTTEGAYDRAAYIVKDDAATVYQLVNGVVTAVARKEGLKATRQQGQYRVLEFTDGATWLDSTGRGCGCSSPLKRWFSQNRPRSVGT